MRKILIALFIMAILINGSPKKNDFTLLDYFEGEYHCYTASDADGVDLGFCCMAQERIESECIGESMRFSNLEIGNALEVLEARVVRTECLDNGTVVIYAHTDMIDDSVSIDNQRVNIQIAHNDQYSVIGWPLILGGF